MQHAARGGCLIDLCGLVLAFRTLQPFAAACERHHLEDGRLVLCLDLAAQSLHFRLKLFNPAVSLLDVAFQALHLGLKVAYFFVFFLGGLLQRVAAHLVDFFGLLGRFCRLWADFSNHTAGDDDC